MAEPGKFFGQVGYDPFGAAIETGGTLSISGAICAIFMMTLISLKVTKSASLAGSFGAG